MLDYEELKEIANMRVNEVIEVSLEDIRTSDLSIIPEGVTLSIFESYFPESLLWREQKTIIIEISDHIYTKYWWHKYHARVFVEAMNRAVKRLQYEGNPLSEPLINSDDDVHIFFSFKLTLTNISSSERVVESIKTAFDLVCERANTILENSDSVLILGKDTDSGLEKLKKIALELEKLGYFTYIIKEQPNKIGESVIQKVLRYAVKSKFIVVENSEPSGHLYELPHVTKMAESVTIILQEEGKGATWMFEDSYKKFIYWKKFLYIPSEFEEKIQIAVNWAEEYIKEFGQYQKANLPWFK